MVRQMIGSVRICGAVRRTALLWSIDGGAYFDSDQLKKDDRSASGAAQSFIANLPEPPTGLSTRDVDFENYLDLATGTRAPDLTELSNPDPDDTSYLEGSNSSRYGIDVDPSLELHAEQDQDSELSPSRADEVGNAPDRAEDLDSSPCPSPGGRLSRFIPPSGIPSIDIIRLY
jgi:hypothetical protein